MQTGCQPKMTKETFSSSSAETYLLVTHLLHTPFFRLIGMLWGFTLHFSDDCSYSQHAHPAETWLDPTLATCLPLSIAPRRTIRSWDIFWKGKFCCERKRPIWQSLGQKDPVAWGIGLTPGPKGQSAWVSFGSFIFTPVLHAIGKYVTVLVTLNLKQS